MDFTTPVAKIRDQGKTIRLQGWQPHHQQLMEIIAPQISQPVLLPTVPSFWKRQEEMLKESGKMRLRY